MEAHKVHDRNRGPRPRPEGKPFAKKKPKAAAEPAGRLALKPAVITPKAKVEAPAKKTAKKK